MFCPSVRRHHVAGVDNVAGGEDCSRFFSGHSETLYPVHKADNYVYRQRVSIGSGSPPGWVSGRAVLGPGQLGDGLGELRYRLREQSL